MKFFSLAERTFLLDHSFAWLLKKLYTFRNVGEIKALAGCDLLTISPKLLAELEASNEPIEKVLDAENASKLENLEKIEVNEATFRWMLNEDQMATEKLSEGIRKFAADQEKMDEMVRQKIVM